MNKNCDIFSFKIPVLHFVYIFAERETEKYENHTPRSLETWIHIIILLYFINAPVTWPYICQRTPTYGDTSDKLGTRCI